MNITPNEIQSIEDIGILDGNPVKLIRCKGGFFIAVGKPKGKQQEEALSAGSHGAIVKFDIEKRYPGFQPSMMKSELYNDNVIVEKHTHFLSDELRKSGHDIYSVQDGSVVDFQITKHNVKVASVSGSFEEEFLVIRDLDIPKQFSGGVAGAVVEKAVTKNAGLKFIK